LGRDAEDEDEDAQQQEEDTQGWRPFVRLTFHGSHVFAGIRQLVESGIIDGERMPGWMTGEEGVTIGAVRNGRIRGHKGSGV
jgi:central kinetochore subunit Mis15/CHL4